MFTVLVGCLTFYQSCFRPELLSSDSVDHPVQESKIQVSHTPTGIQGRMPKMETEKHKNDPGSSLNPVHDVSINCCELLPAVCEKDEDYETKQMILEIPLKRAKPAVTSSARLEMRSEYIGALGGRFVVVSVNGVISDVYTGERAAEIILPDRVLFARCDPAVDTKTFQIQQAAESTIKCRTFKEFNWPMYSCPIDGETSRLRIIAEKDGGRHLNQEFVASMRGNSICTKQFHFAKRDHFITYLSALSGNRMDNTALLFNSVEFWHLESYENFVPTTSDFPAFIPVGEVQKDDWELFGQAFAIPPKFFMVSIVHPNGKSRSEELVLKISVCEIDSSEDDPVENSPDSNTYLERG